MALQVENSIRPFQRLLNELQILLPIMIVTVGVSFLASEAISNTEFAKQEREKRDVAPIRTIGLSRDNQLRIEHATRWYSGNSSEQLLAVIIGSCTMREAVSLDAFNARYRPEWNVMALCSTGFVVPAILRHSKQVDQLPIKPNHVVIGMSPRDMFDDRHLGSAPAPSVTDTAAQNAESGTAVNLTAVSALTRLSEEFAIRGEEITSLADSVLTEFRSQLLGVRESVGIELRKDLEDINEGYDPSNPDPFREVIYLAQDGNLPSNKEEEGDSTMGLDFTAFDLIEVVSQPVVDRIRRWLQDGVSVTVVFLPEHSSVRDDLSDDACRRCCSFLEQQLAEYRRFRLVDFRDRLPDSGFGDLFHIGPTGRKTVVPLLIPLIVPADDR